MIQFDKIDSLLHVKDYVPTSIGYFQPTFFDPVPAQAPILSNAGTIRPICAAYSAS